MEDKYLKYIIENHSTDPKISPILDRYLTDVIDIEQFSFELVIKGVISYKNFTKRQKIKDILNK